MNMQLKMNMNSVRREAPPVWKPSTCVVIPWVVRIRQVSREFAKMYSRGGGQISDISVFIMVHIMVKKKPPKGRAVIVNALFIYLPFLIIGLDWKLKI